MNSGPSPSVNEQLAEATYLLCVVAFYGPPVLLLLAPWLLLSLILMGPFLAMLTVIVVSCVAAILIGAAGALLVTAVQRIRTHRGAPTPAVSLRTRPELSR